MFSLKIENVNHYCVMHNGIFPVFYLHEYQYVKYFEENYFRENVFEWLAI